MCCLSKPRKGLGGSFTHARGEGPDCQARAGSQPVEPSTNEVTRPGELAGMEHHKKNSRWSASAAHSERSEAITRLDLGHPVTRPHVWLRQTIETTVLPRLVTDARAELLLAPDGQSPDPMRPNAADVHLLAELLLREDFDASERFVERFQQAGYGAEQVMLELLTPAARLLGDRWVADSCNFTEVTIGLGRLQSMVFDMGRQERPDSLAAATPTAGRRALLLAMPGSHHTLGVLMLSEFFRRAGWDVSDEACDALSEVRAVVCDHWFDLIGLSASTDAHLEALPSVILALRRHSRNPSVVVMAGGPAFVQNPDLAVAVGADFTAADARIAVEEAGRQLERIVPRR